MSLSAEEPRPSFYLKWVVLNAITVVVAWYITWGTISLVENLLGGTIRVGGHTRITQDFLFIYVFFPVVGFTSGMIQFILLRRYLPRMTAWIPMTILGWLMPFILGYVVTKFLNPDNSTPWIVIGMLVIGSSIALPQWWILHKRVRYAAWWILSNGLGWGMVGLMNLVTTEPLPVLYALAISSSVASGVACWLLLSFIPRHDVGGAYQAIDIDIFLS